MSEAEAFLLNSKEIENNDKMIDKCEKDDKKSGGCFKLNGWKTTLLIVLVYFKNGFRVLMNLQLIISSFFFFFRQGSLLVRYFVFSKMPAYRRRTDGFLQLVPETYDEDELVEWEPVPAPISHPNEPGDLGIWVLFFRFLRLKFSETFSKFISIFSR